ncbi:MAG: T9SS type A sorting domain-containing protein [Chitinophagaceae bacterium]|nr:T9SS type A sorting domain-containing protein [Chitinophagaceae bacterium]
MIGCDGGIHYSSDGGTTIRDRNRGLRIKQFYSCAIHPSSTNYFLAGAQDNGSHKFTLAGLGNTEEVTGGDGAFVHIDQNEPSYQFTSYLYQYRRSTNGGTSWSSVNLSGSLGQFINPTDYDDVANIMYCANSAGTYRRWTNPQTGAASASVSITALNSNTVSAVTVSPYTSNRVYFGTENDVAGSRICYVDGANSIASGSAGTDISTGLPTNVYTSCIAVGSTDNNLMVCYSNYGVQQVWLSTNGGSSWTNIDGNLPDMPVRWCMFVPGDDDKAIIATEAGVYLTLDINAGSTAWIPSPTFPTVRTDMLQYRPSDGMVAAATHGRLWTQPYLSIVSTNKFLLKGKWNGHKAELHWEAEGIGPGNNLDIESSSDGVYFTRTGSLSTTALKSYNYSHTPGLQEVYYRIRSNEKGGISRYSNTIRLYRSGTSQTGDRISIYPNPVKDQLQISSYLNKGSVSYTVSAMNGQVLWRKEETITQAGNIQRNWSMSGLVPGVYLFTIRTVGESSTRKFIKQ